jgi:hypothetical protein
MREAVHEGAPVDEAGQGVGRGEYAQVDSSATRRAISAFRRALSASLAVPLRHGFFLVATQRDFRPEHAAGNQDGGDRKARGEGQRIGAGAVSGPPSAMMAVAMAMPRPDQTTPSRGGRSIIETTGNEKNHRAWPCSSPEWQPGR